MEYLLLWSGDKKGMRKARIPAIEARGISGHYRDGKFYRPDMTAIRAALPFRYRAAMDREPAMWFDKHDDGKAATMRLYSSRGKELVQLYLQPLKGENQ